MLDAIPLNAKAFELPRSNVCEAMLRPCDELRASGKCQLCIATYLVKELRKIKDELKLLNARVDQMAWVEYGDKDRYPKLHTP